MLQLDHLTVVAPDLVEGVAHVRACLDLDVPFGQRHGYMGTYNHLLQLGGTIYLEIVALDPQARGPARPRWFGLDDEARVRADWDAGRRLRGWVARSDDIGGLIAAHGNLFGEQVPLPPDDPSFDFAIPADGRLPLDGAAPAIIDRRGRARDMTRIGDRGARLTSFVLEHPEPAAISTLYAQLAVDRPPMIVKGAAPRYRAQIETPSGLRELA